MYRHTAKHLTFVTRFVDSVTVRPFFDDLRRSSETAQLSAPRRPRRIEAKTEAA